MLEPEHFDLSGKHLKKIRKFTYVLNCNNQRSQSRRPAGEYL